MEEHSSETLMSWALTNGGVARLQRGRDYARFKRSHVVVSGCRGSYLFLRHVDVYPDLGIYGFFLLGNSMTTSLWLVGS